MIQSFKKNVLMFLSFSYEERLKTMMLREEFFPLMEEVKNSVAVMTKAANGDLSHASTKAANHWYPDCV